MQEILPFTCCLHFPSFLYIKFHQSNISLHNHVFGHLHCASLIIFRSHTGTTSTTLLDREQKNLVGYYENELKIGKIRFQKFHVSFLIHNIFKIIILIKYFLYIITFFLNGIFTSVGKIFDYIDRRTLNI